MARDLLTPAGEQRLRTLGYVDIDGVWQHYRYGWRLRHPRRMLAVDFDTARRLHSEAMWSRRLWDTPVDQLRDEQIDAVHTLDLHWYGAAGRWCPLWGGMVDMDDATLPLPRRAVRVALSALPPPFFSSDALARPDEIRRSLARHRRRSCLALGTMLALALAVAAAVSWLLLGWVLGLRTWLGGLLALALLWSTLRLVAPLLPWLLDRVRHDDPACTCLGPAWLRVLERGQPVQTDDGLYLLLTDRHVALDQLRQLDPRHVELAFSAIRASYLD